MSGPIQVSPRLTTIAVICGRFQAIPRDLSIKADGGQIMRFKL